MLIKTQVNINATAPEVWAAIIDIKNAANILSGVEKIEIVEPTSDGLVGLRWRETRMYFGKPATVEKWITEAADDEFYKTRAEDSGFVFLSTMKISDSSGTGVTLAAIHDSQPQGFAAKLKSTPMFFFKGVIKKALLRDLNDIKSAVEQG
jgi:hypothetical protein